MPSFLSTDLEIVSVQAFDFGTPIGTDVTEDDAAYCGHFDGNPSSSPHLRSYHALRMKFVDDTVCTHWNYNGIYPNRYWEHAIHVVQRPSPRPRRAASRRAPAAGQTPTFHPPQRIGGVGDIGAIDIAAVDVKPHSGEAGQPEGRVPALPRQVPSSATCFRCSPPTVLRQLHPRRVQRGGRGLPRHGGPHARRHQLCAYHDRGFSIAPIHRSRAGGTRVSYLVLEWTDDVLTAGTNERVAPGIQAGSIIEITEWQATHDVTYVLSRNRNRFYVEEAGEFFIKIDTGLAYWRYVEGSYNPCDGYAPTRVTLRSALPMRPASIRLWIASMNNKVPKCDVMGPRCRKRHRRDRLRGQALGNAWTCTTRRTRRLARSVHLAQPTTAASLPTTASATSWQLASHHLYPTLPRGGVNGIRW